jgi:predicted enzyme related to lactoylglutathione lyase
VAGVALPEGWSRDEPDSSGLARPVVLARVSVRPEDLDDRVAFYESVLGVACDSRTPVPGTPLVLATVGNVLLIASPHPPGDAARATAFTLLVASVGDHLDSLAGTGAEVTEPMVTEPMGSRARVRYADGTLVEVIDRRPLPGERPAGPGA